jgi:hypothetical protein
MIQDTNKTKIAEYVAQGGWIGDVGYKVNNLIGLYETSAMPAMALKHMLTEMLKITKVDGTPSDLLQKVELNNVIDAIILDIDPDNSIDPNA